MMGKSSLLAGAALVALATPAIVLASSLERPASHATTRLTDVIYGPLFLPTTIQRITTSSVLRQSGIAVDDAEIRRFAQSPGDILTMPFWNDISGASNVSSDDPAQQAVPNKITQSQDAARKIRRNNGWQSANLVTSLLTEDPLDVIAGLIAQYWVREEQVILGATLNGVFASTAMADHILPAFSEDGANANAKIVLDPEVASNAYALMGERGGQLTAVLMHSRVFWNLHAAGYIVYGENPADVAPGTPRPAFWDGKRVLVSDLCPRRAGTTSGYVYTSYLFATGAIAYAECVGAAGPKKPVELASDASAGNGEGVETVWYRRHWVMHPRGIKFVGTPAGESPTNAELATGSTWSRVYDPLNIRIVAVRTNG